MKTRHVLGAMMGAALLSGTAFAEPDGPQGKGPRDEGQGMRPACEGQQGARMRRGGPGQEGGQGMMQGRRPEGMGGPQMRRGGPDQEGGQGMMQGRRPDGEGGPQMQRGGPGPGMEIGRKPFHNPQRLKDAGATDKQLTALKTFANEQQIKRIDLQATVDKAELTLDQLMSSETADEKSALKAVDALSQARAEIFKLEVSSKLKMNEILGAEVQKKLREMGPPEGMERQGRGPRPEGRQGKDAPPAGDRPTPPEQK